MLGKHAVHLSLSLVACPTIVAETGLALMSAYRHYVPTLNTSTVECINGSGAQ